MQIFFLKGHGGFSIGRPSESNGIFILRQDSSENRGNASLRYDAERLLICFDKGIQALGEIVIETIDAENHKITHIDIGRIGQNDSLPIRGDRTEKVALNFVGEAFQDVGIGPSEDGGYYLIGLTRAEHASLFDGIPWSSSGVLKATLRKAEIGGISYELLPEKSDVDTVDDLKNLSGSTHDHSCAGERISVIIPVLNEERHIESTLIDLFKRHHPDEVIVVDGGSTDKTVALASKYAKILSSQKGRAAQMNAGAAAATGDILLFLHADTKLPDHALEKVRTSFQSGKSNSGRFRMKFGHPHPLLRFYEFQTRFHFFSYGDQAFFVRKSFFEQMGGFDIHVPFEDIDFYRRLLKHEKPVIIKDPVITSPRRFLQNGILKQKLTNIALATMYYLGFGQATLKRFTKAWYKDVRTP